MNSETSKAVIRNRSASIVDCSSTSTALVTLYVGDDDPHPPINTSTARQFKARFIVDPLMDGTATVMLTARIGRRQGHKVP
jgi:hypothetical protein